MSALVRPTHGRMIGGVCAGLARRFGTSATTSDASDSRAVAPL